MAEVSAYETFTMTYYLKAENFSKPVGWVCQTCRRNTQTSETWHVPKTTYLQKWSQSSHSYFSLLDNCFACFIKHMCVHWLYNVMFGQQTQLLGMHIASCIAVRKQSYKKGVHPIQLHSLLRMPRSCTHVLLQVCTYIWICTPSEETLNFSYITCCKDFIKIWTFAQKLRFSIN